MTTSAFPPATPVLDAVATLRQKLANLDQDDLRHFGRQVYAVLVFMGGVLLAIGKRLHLMLKGTIILFRVFADLLERLDDWIEYMIVANSARIQPTPEQTPAPAPAPLLHAAAAVPEPESPQARPARRRTKRSAAAGFTPATA